MDKTEKKDNQTWKVVGACGVSAIGIIFALKMNPAQITEVSVKLIDTFARVLSK